MKKGDLFGGLVTSQIDGGYYIKARKIQTSEIMRAPPCVREVWDYLLMMANHSDNLVCKRGQHITTVNAIREALCWYAGWRKETYKKSACENSMKWLRERGMITTTKTTRGTLVTICNYSFYQDPKNYESRTATSTNADHVPKPCRTINKNEKNIRNKNEKNNTPKPPEGDELPLEVYVDVWNIAAKNSWLPRVAKLTEKRRKLLRAAVKEMPEVKHWADSLLELMLSDFHSGKSESGWKADFDWFIQPTKHNYLKFYEQSQNPKPEERLF